MPRTYLHHSNAFCYFNLIFFYFLGFFFYYYLNKSPTVDNNPHFQEHPLFSVDSFHDPDEEIDEDEEDEDAIDTIDDNDDDNKNDGDGEYIDDLICKDTEFKCHNNPKCVSLEKYCDNIEDCPDGSDESNCASTPRIPYSNRTDRPSTEGDTNPIYYFLIKFLRQMRISPF